MKVFDERDGIHGEQDIVHSEQRVKFSELVVMPRVVVNVLQSGRRMGVGRIGGRTCAETSA